MNVYNIADLNVVLDCQSRTMNRAEKYRIRDFVGKPDFVITTPIEKIKASESDLSEEILAYLHEGKLFYLMLSNLYNGMMIHSSAIVVDDKAYLFTAPSGTGKSTHTRHWLKLFENSYILNDDKPAIRILEDGVYAYGTPWSGKDDISVNKKVKLQGICVLQRDKINWIKPMDYMESIIRLYQSTIHKIEKDEIDRLMGIIQKIALRIPIWEMGCTPTIESAQMAFDAMSKAEVK